MCQFHDKNHAAIVDAPFPAQQTHGLSIRFKLQFVFADNSTEGGESEFDSFGYTAFTRDGFRKKILWPRTPTAHMVTWQDCYSVKIEEIDRQHKKLLELINGLEIAMYSGNGEDALEQTLAGLIEYTQTHFVYEERLMAAHGYPDLEHHRSEHVALTNRVLDLLKKYHENRVGLTVTTANFLSDWLTYHMLCRDKKYAIFLRSNGLA